MEHPLIIYIYLYIYICVCVRVCVEMINCSESDIMTEICRKLDKSNTFGLVESAIFRCV